MTRVGIALSACLVAVGVLSIAAVGSCELTVLWPNGGETLFTSACDYYLTWSDDNPNPPATVEICVWDHSAFPIYALEPITVPNNEPYKWSTPVEPWGPDMWYFKVSYTTAPISDESDGPFTLAIDDDGEDDCQ